MRIIKGISAISRLRSPVVAIGMFDGMHIGHAEILKGCARAARASGGTAVVLTFEPHPQSEESIYSLDHRFAIMSRLGIDACVLLRFSPALKKMTAEEFIRRILVGRLGVRTVMVGENFSFGRGLAGDVSLLKRESVRYGYKVVAYPVRRAGGRPVSSTRIRECIRRGRFAEAERMLGRKVSLMGTVAHGRRVGRRLGYPTANLRPRHEVLPPDGIYAVRASVDGRDIPAVLYKGPRPTFGGSAVSVEVHLLGFAGNLYGKTMEVCFYRRLRSDKKFSSPRRLALAISRDIKAAKKILSRG